MGESERQEAVENRIAFVGVEVTRVGPSRIAARVELAMAGTHRYIGLGERENSDDGEIICAAEATSRALEQYAEDAVELKVRSVFSLKDAEAVVVAINMKHAGDGSHLRLIGSCLVRDTPARAAALAVLNASNRALGSLLGTARQLRFRGEQLQEEIHLHEQLVAELERNLALLSTQGARGEDNVRSDGSPRDVQGEMGFPEGTYGLLCTHDLEGRIIYGSPAAASILGYGANELRGMNMRDLVSPSTRHLFGEYLERIAGSSQDEGLLLVMTRSGEERMWIYENALNERPDGTKYVIGRARDITELARTGIISVPRMGE